jgi:hypothetical protein
MPKVDDRLWLNDALWEQIKPPRARGRIAISFALAVLVVGAWLAQWAGMFHPSFVANGVQGGVRGDTLTLMVDLQNTSQIPVHVKGFRADQPAAHLVGVVIGDETNVAPAPILTPPSRVPSSTRITPFTAPPQRSFDVVLYYKINCLQLHSPLRLDVGTRGMFGNQTTTVSLSGLDVQTLCSTE